jgi:hypothetical protein
MPNTSPPAEVAKIRAAIASFFNTRHPNGRSIGSAKCGVYAFFDYDGEPIYVGQTVEGLRGRVGRHLTGRRSDAVGKFVLDPFEVLEIEVWPLFDAADLPPIKKKAFVNAIESTVYQKALKSSQFGAVLNEAVPPHFKPVKLPQSSRGRIIPPDLYEERKHPDLRIARRAQTISSLARLISERKVGKGLRKVLHVQSERLASLAGKRLKESSGEPEDVEDVDE